MLKNATIEQGKRALSLIHCSETQNQWTVNKQVQIHSLLSRGCLEI